MNLNHHLCISSCISSFGVFHWQDSFPSGSAPPQGPFLFQAPCFEGCAFFPGPWRHFQEYHRQRLHIADSELPPAPGSPSGGQRWRRHLAEMMCARGMLVLHPPLHERGQPLQVCRHKDALQDQRDVVI